MPKISIVIPHWNRRLLLRNCLECIRATVRRPDCGITVVDNGSYDGSLELAGHFPRVKWIWLGNNLGFARACNIGAQRTSGQYLLFLNNDTEPTFARWLDILVDVLDSERTIAAAGPKLVFPDEQRIQSAGIEPQFKRGKFSRFVERYRGRPVGWSPANQACDVGLNAACLLIRREAFAHGFDEGYINGQEDIDLMLRLHTAGLRTRYEPSSVVVHHEGGSGAERTKYIRHNRERLRSKWKSVLDGLASASAPTATSSSPPAR